MPIIAIITPVSNVDHFNKVAAQFNDNMITIRSYGIDGEAFGVASETDRVLVAPAMLKQAYRAQGKGADAIILNCSFEPALAACRELLNIPTFGVTECSLQTIAGSYHRFSAIAPNLHSSYIPLLTNKIHQSNCSASLVGSYEVTINHETKLINEKQLYEGLDKSIKADAQAILFFSSYLIGYQQKASDYLNKQGADIPILIPIECAIHRAKQFIMEKKKVNAPYPHPLNQKIIASWELKA